MPSPADSDENRPALLAVPEAPIEAPRGTACQPKLEASTASCMPQLRQDLAGALVRVAQGDRAALELLSGASSVKLYGNVQRILGQQGWGQQDWGRQDWADAVLEDVVEQISRRVDRPVAMVKSSLRQSLAQLKECLGR